MLSLWFLALAGMPGGAIEVGRFDPIPKEVEAYLGDPYNFAFSPQGELFLVNRDAAKVFVWKKDGSFARAFGKSGQGPGEMFYPFHLAVNENEVWVMDLRRQVSIFDHQGTFIRSFKVPNNQPRAFNLLGDGQSCMIYPVSNAVQGFELHDKEGKHIRPILEIDRTAPLSTQSWQAYAPDAEAQPGPDGLLYIGFSQDKVLYQVDSGGNIVGKRSFQLVTDQATDEEEERFKKLDMFAPFSQTGRIRSDSRPIDFSQPKAYYTHFLIKGDKIAFILTPTGGFWGMGLGYPEATFTICDFNTGERLSTGRYSYPEDSMVLFENGRILGFILYGERDREILEIELEGM